jgi:hypothetical protein
VINVVVIGGRDSNDFFPGVVFFLLFSSFCRGFVCALVFISVLAGVLWRFSSARSNNCGRCGRAQSMDVLGDRLAGAFWPFSRARSSIASLLDVLGSGGLVLADEILGDVPREPVGEFEEFLAKPVDGLLIHVGLGDQLGEGNCMNC